MRDHETPRPGPGEREAPPGTELLTPLEVAERLKCSRATVYKLIRDGDLPALRVGNGFRVDWSRAYAQMSQPTSLPRTAESAP